MGRLEWNRVEQDRDVLECILALLLALAALADRAAGLSAAKRLHVLAILGCGEAEARSLIVEIASGAPAEATAAPTRAGDAARLAASFRMLALALDALLAQVRGQSLCRQASPPAMLADRKPYRAAQSTPSPALRATSPPVRGTRGAPARLSTSRIPSQSPQPSEEPSPRRVCSSKSDRKS